MTDMTSPRQSLSRLNDANFLAQAKVCYAEIGASLRALTDQHTQAVVVGALGEEVPASLAACRMTQTCTPEEERDVIERIKSGIIQDLPDSPD